MKRKLLLTGGVVLALLPLSPFLISPTLSVLLNFGPTNTLVLGLWKYHRGDASDCGPLDSVRAIAHGRAIAASANEMLRRHHRIRSDGEMELWATPMGEFWVNRGAYMAEFFGTIAEQDRDIYDLSKLRPGSVVLDCGANYGVTVKKALLAGAGQVIAIEPAPNIVACLRRTFGVEIQAGRVIVYGKGVWDREDVLRLHRSGVKPWGDSFVGPTLDLPDIVAPLTTIDAVVAELGLGRVDFIKMDIEGAEPRAISGARRTIRRFRPRMAICVYHNPGDRDAVRAALERAAVPYAETCPCKEWHGKIIRNVERFAARD